MRQATRKHPLWTMGDDEQSKNARVLHLAQIFVNKDLGELQSAISMGLNVNEWYNTHPAVMKSTVEEHRTYTPRHLRNVDKNDRLQPLHLCAACRWTEGAAELIKAGADVNSSDYRVSPHQHYTDTSYTPLMHACCYAGVPMVKLLLDSGADPSAVDPASGSTPVSLAMTYFCFPIIQLLFDKGVMLQGKDADCLPLQDAVEVFINPLLKITNAHQLSEKDLQDKTEDVRMTALHLCKLLLTNGSDPNRTQVDTLPSLHLCAEGARGDLRGVELLVSYGADVNLMTSGAYFHQYKSLTPLLTAVCAGNISTVVWLIQHGAEVDQKYVRFYRGRTIGDPISALSIAIEEHLLEVVVALVKSGCTVTADNMSAMQAVVVELKEADHQWYDQSGEHMSQILASVELIEDLLEFLHKPQRLKWLVRSALRCRFGVKGVVEIDTLPLPRAMKEFIMCYEL